MVAQLRATLPFIVPCLIIKQSVQAQRVLRRHLVALVTGWLGGELVDRLGVGVDEEANVNAPGSLSGRPARAVSEKLMPE